MNQEAFRRIVASSLVPMLQGTLRPEPERSTPRERTSAFVKNQYALAVKLHRSDESRLVIERSHAFSSDESSLAKEFVNELGSIAGLKAPENYEADLLGAVPRRVAARHLNRGDPDGLLTTLLEGLENWSAATYEGQRIAAALSLEADDGPTDVPLDSLWDKPYGPVLSNGIDTVLRIGGNGGIIALESLATTAAPSSHAPFRFGPLAAWSADHGVAAALTRQSEILVFAGGKLRFAKRAGRWLHYAHEATVTRFTLPHDRSMRHQLYATCLDVSFARTGGCLGIVDSANKSDLLAKIDAADRISAASSYKARFLRQVVQGRKFDEMDRRVRLEVLSMDGATILDTSGNVLGAGVIIEIPQGERDHGGGGRTAAARFLSNFGLGVKISEDGSIKGFKQAESHFET
jgi:hypothetical protein